MGVPTPEADQVYLGEILTDVFGIPTPVFANTDDANAKWGFLNYSRNPFHSFVPYNRWIFILGHYPSSTLDFEGSPLGLRSKAEDLLDRRGLSSPNESSPPLTALPVSPSL